MSIVRKNRVQVTSMLTAVSSKPSEPGRVHSFTTLDNLLAPYTVHVIFYYARNPFGSLDLDSARISLSELLSLYPPAVGRFTKDPDGVWKVKCNDAGLRVLRAKVCVGINEWLRSAGGDEEKDLTVWEDMPEEDPSIWSPFRLQVNEFEGGGVAIGLSCPHRVADLTTLTVLLKSWSESQRRQSIVHPPSFSNTNAVKSESELFPITTKSAMVTATATATFRFSDSAYKKYLNGIFPKDSPFDVFTALFWTRVALLKPKRDRVTICGDFRRRLTNLGFFGNALSFTSLEIADVVDKEIGHVARLINDHVANIDVEKSLSEGELYGGDLTIVNMEHMIVEGEALMYEAVFEDGVRPMHVSYRIGNDGGEGVIIVMPSPEKGFGRIVSVTLPEEEMLKLLSDQEILKLEPEIILSSLK